MPLKIGFALFRQIRVNSFHGKGQGNRAARMSNENAGVKAFLHAFELALNIIIKYTRMGNRNAADGGCVGASHGQFAGLGGMSRGNQDAHVWVNRGGGGVRDVAVFAKRFKAGSNSVNRCVIKVDKMFDRRFGVFELF